MPVSDVPISAEGLLALTWSLTSVVAIFLTIRLFVHRRQHLNTPAILTSDALLSLSLLFGIAVTSTDAWKYNLEIQGRTRTVTLKEKTNAAKLSFICAYLVFTAMWLAKGACLAYYYHLFPNLSPKLRKYLLFVTGFTACSYVVVILVQSLWCRPVARNWNEKCYATGNRISLPFWSFLNIFTDISILVLPLSVLRSIQLGRRQTAALVVVFLIGGLSIFAAIVRLIVIYPKVLEDETTNIINTYELWACIEITTCQLAVCLPALRAFLRDRKSKKEQSWNSKGSRGGEKGFSQGSTVEAEKGKAGEGSSF